MHATDSPLDERLVHVTLDLLAHEGLESVTLRRIARVAGVSHGAPLRHFRNLADLLAEVGARGFALLCEALEKAAAQLPPGAGPMARLEAGGRAYVKCALDKPGLFSLMFRFEDLDIENENLKRESHAAFEKLVDLVRAAQDAGWHPQRRTRVLAGSVWASLHGLTSLWAQGSLPGPTPDATLEEAIDTTVELVLGDRPGDPT